MEAKRIGVRIGITKNLGNYESLRIDYEMVVDLNLEEDKPGTSIDMAREYLFRKLKKDLTEAEGGLKWGK